MAAALQLSKDWCCDKFGLFKSLLATNLGKYCCYGLGSAVSLYAVRVGLRKRWGQCKSRASLCGQTVLITGANSGLGKATALELVKRGALVVMACRDIGAGSASLEEIKKQVPTAKLELRHLDLASFDSIEDFVRDVTQNHVRIDIVICNAGIMRCPYMTTTEGFEYQMGVNHIGHFFLLKLLMDSCKLKPRRVVVVSSRLYSKARLDVKELSVPKEKYDKAMAYSNSKLANALFVQQLAVKYPEVSSYCVTPGIVYTNLGRYMDLRWYWYVCLAPIAVFYVRTPYEGCQTILHCAISDEVEDESGLVYSNCKRDKYASVAQDSELARQLWEETELLIRTTRLRPPVDIF